MELTKNALEEADNWTKLITDIEIVNFEQYNILLNCKNTIKYVNLLYLVNGQWRN